jgi:phospholipase A1/A2
MQSTNEIHHEAYASQQRYEDNLDNLEAKFQISLKVPLNSESMLIEGDSLYLGFSLQAW